MMNQDTIINLVLFGIGTIINLVLFVASVILSIKNSKDHFTQATKHYEQLTLVQILAIAHSKPAAEFQQIVASIINLQMYSNPNIRKQIEVKKQDQSKGS